MPPFRAPDGGTTCAFHPCLDAPPVLVPFAKQFLHLFSMGHASSVESTPEDLSATGEPEHGGDGAPEDGSDVEPEGGARLRDHIGHIRVKALRNVECFENHDVYNFTTMR